MALQEAINTRWPALFAQKVKSEPGATAEAEKSSAASGTNTPAAEQLTTKGLAKDPEVNKAVKDFIAASEALGGLKDLLSLSELRSTVDLRSKGEKAEKIDKPLLIGDYLTSNLFTSYFDESEEEVISGSLKLVRSGKSKRPSVVDYTPEIWAAASFRIVQKLLKDGDNDILREYVRYSEMIADYLSVYQNSGVFALDYEHRHRVCKEGHIWSDISRHDENRFLKHMSEPLNQRKNRSSNRKSQGLKSGGLHCIQL